jgi:hypothetical protein
MTGKLELPNSQVTFFRFGIYFLVVLLLLTFYGYLSFKANQSQIRSSARIELASVADLKVNDLLIWRNQRLEDALSFQEYHDLPNLFETLLKNPNSPAIQTEILTRISLLQSVNQYDILFIDTKEKTLFTFPKTASPLCENVIQEIPEVLASGQITFIDLHHSEVDKNINMSLLIPVKRENTNIVIGFINLRINPALYLYPMLQKWPNDSITAETLLVRKDGADVLFLNNLRFKNESALQLRIPLTNLKAPSVQAVLGRIGYFEGLDYRGEPVVSELRPVPNRIGFW